MFLESERQSGEQGVSAKHAQRAIELMGEFDGFSGVATRAGQKGQSDGMGAESYGVVGSDDALIVQAEAAGEIEATGKRRKSEAASEAERAKRRL